MHCKFEEKQYEQHLNNELLMRKELLYVPGQVLEGKLGFDAALYSSNRKFWRLFEDVPFFPFFHRKWVNKNRPGILLLSEWWQELEQMISFFPSFQFNVFVQHKRPEYLTATNSKQWADWQRPYFRYKLTEHQQKALEQLEVTVNHKAIIVYASPAFIEHQDLWNAIANSKLIERSNFAQPSKLVGHHFYSYADAGKNGKAHSESVDVESYDFYQQFNRLAESIEYPESNHEFIVLLGSQVNLAIDNCGKLSHTYHAILEEIEFDINNEFQLAMARIAVFNFVTGSVWHVYTGTHRVR